MDKEVKSNNYDSKIHRLIMKHNTHNQRSKFNLYLYKKPFRSALIESLFTTFGLIILFVLLGLIPTEQSVLLNRFFIFILAIFIGYMVIWNVTPQLHTPLMSVTNAISGIIIVGSMLGLRSDAFFEANSICSFIGVFFASINVFGGFIVTQRMLNMFKSF